MFSRYPRRTWRKCIVSIPQAVGTIAMGLQKASGVAYYTVSIPQAVGTIAIAETVVLGVIAVLMVSIPQAVGTIAICSF